MNRSKQAAGQKRVSFKSVGSGLIASILASLCCITPVLSMIAGISGIAATFSWVEPFRPYLMILTVGVLSFAWYQKLKPRTKEEIECACETDEKPSFWQSKKFLGIVTVFAGLMLAFPSYSPIFYPEPKSSNLMSEAQNTLFQPVNLKTIELSVKGMTCSSCEAPVTKSIGELVGIGDVKTSFESANTIVKYDPSKVTKNQIVEAITKVGYKVIENPE